MRITRRTKAERLDPILMHMLAVDEVYGRWNAGDGIGREGSCV